MSEQQQFWFAARTRKDQEIAVRNSLKKIGMEHYIPTQIVVRQLKYRKKEIEIPVIRNLVFVYATKEKACSLVNDYGIRLFYVKNVETGGLLVVPDKQMNDFMLVMNIDPTGVSFDNELLEVGEKVQVVKGEFAGVEGELVRIANRSYVVIRIPQVFFASVRIPKSYLKKIRSKAY